MKKKNQLCVEDLEGAHGQNINKLIIVLFLVSIIYLLPHLPMSNISLENRRQAMPQETSSQFFADIQGPKVTIASGTPKLKGALDDIKSLILFLPGFMHIDILFLPKYQKLFNYNSRASRHCLVQHVSNRVINQST